MNILITLTESQTLSGSPLYNYTLFKELIKNHQVDFYSRTSPCRFVDIKALPNLSKKPKDIYDVAFVSQNDINLREIFAHKIIQVCHSEHIEIEQPIINPRIYKYVAIRPTIADNLKKKYDIPNNKIEVIYNGIDRTIYSPLKRIKPNPAYTKIVLPCTADQFRIKFLNYYASVATKSKIIFHYGHQYNPINPNKNKWFVSSPAVEDVSTAIADANYVAGVLLGRINLEANSMQIPSFIHSPEIPEQKEVFLMDEQDFNRRHNIIEVAKDLMKI